METILKITRESSFITLPSQDDTSQCGREGARSYKYKVTIEATDKYLTPQGFVMDNFHIWSYFNEKYVVKKTPCDSCEKMALEAIHHFRILFEGTKELRPVDLRSIYVMISGAEGSSIEAEWKK